MGFLVGGFFLLLPVLGGGGRGRDCQLNCEGAALLFDALHYVVGLVLDWIDVFGLHRFTCQVLLDFLLERGEVAAEMLDETRVGPAGKWARCWVQWFIFADVGE